MAAPVRIIPYKSFNLGHFENAQITQSDVTFFLHNIKHKTGNHLHLKDFSEPMKLFARKVDN